MNIKSWIEKAIRIPLALVMALGLSLTAGPVVEDAQALPIVPPVMIFMVMGAMPASDQPAGSFLINGVCPDVGAPLPCTLREAVAEANAAAAVLVPPAWVQVTFPAPIPIDINYGPITVGSNVVIQGFPGAGPVLTINMVPPVFPLPPTPPPYNLFSMMGANSEIFGLVINSPAGTVTEAITITGNNNLVDFNTILFSNFAGVHVAGPSPLGGSNNVIQQNWLGIDSVGACGPNRYGIHIDGGAANTTVLQNYISCNIQHGVFVDSLLGSPTIPPVTTTLIDTNRIGTDISGLIARPNQLSGIYDDQGVTTIIKNNLISGNTLDGITLDESQGTQVTNQNLVGTDATGSLALPNGANGIYLKDYTQSATIDQNVISGNLADGIFLDGGNNTSNTITRNKIGVDTTGTVALGNGDDGIQIVQASANTIGGLIPADGRNIISANDGHGINIQSADNTLMYSNYIGLDVSGAGSLGNGGDGIHINGPSSVNNVISPVVTVDPQPEQFISCNSGDGIFINDSSNTIIGPTTYIGVLADKSTACGNDEAGINLDDSAIGTEINAQIIAFNGIGTLNPGIRIYGNNSYGNQIGPVPVGSERRMDIYSNGGLPIDLIGDGHTPNDAGDTDVGPNTLLNYPEITGFTATTVSGTVCNNCIVGVLRAFYNPAANGGGGSYIAQTTATGINWTITIPTGYDLGDLTFVAYDPSTWDTSEMSPRLLFYMPLILRP